MSKNKYVLVVSEPRLNKVKRPNLIEETAVGSPSVDSFGHFNGCYESSLTVHGLGGLRHVLANTWALPR